MTESGYSIKERLVTATRSPAWIRTMPPYLSTGIEPAPKRIV